MPTRFRYALGATILLATLPIRALRLIIPAKNSADWEGEIFLSDFALVGEAAALARRTNINTNEQL
jgi:hypothetical protein